jgi:hypothetical protein
MSAQLVPGDISIFSNAPSRDHTILRCNLFTSEYPVVLQFKGAARCD